MPTMRYSALGAPVRETVSPELITRCVVYSGVSGSAYGSMSAMAAPATPAVATMAAEAAAVSSVVLRRIKVVPPRVGAPAAPDRRVPVHRAG